MKLDPPEASIFITFPPSFNYAAPEDSVLFQNTIADSTQRKISETFFEKNVGSYTRNSHGIIQYTIIIDFLVMIIIQTCGSSLMEINIFINIFMISTDHCHL